MNYQVGDIIKSTWHKGYFMILGSAHKYESDVKWTLPYYSIEAYDLGRNQITTINIPVNALHELSLISTLTES